MSAAGGTNNVKHKPTKQHYVTIKRPSTTLGTKGQRSGSDSTLLENVPCSIETLSGRELELARQTVADATHRVIMWADPSNPLLTSDYLVLGTRTLRIGHFDDVDQQGLEYMLLCVEER